jgi:hypothetical protein
MLGFCDINDYVVSAHWRSRCERKEYPVTGKSGTEKCSPNSNHRDTS